MRRYIIEIKNVETETVNEKISRTWMRLLRERFGVPVQVLLELTERGMGNDHVFTVLRGEDRHVED